MKGYRSSYTPTSYALFAATGVLIPLGGYGFSGGLLLSSEKSKPFKPNPRAGLPAKQAPYCFMSEDAIQKMFTESLKQDAKARFAFLGVK